MDFSLIENSVTISNVDKYAAIIGEKPSLGARSPVLWNAAFKKLDLNYRMLPFDVSEDNILIYFNILKKMFNFQ